MEHLFKRHLITILLTLLSQNTLAYDGANFKVLPPANYAEESGMFGSDVMLMKKDARDKGTSFFKFFQSPDEIKDFKQFLKNRVESSKTVRPINLSPIETKKVNGHDLYYLTYEVAGKPDLSLTAVIVKNPKEYLFVMMKSSKGTFEHEKTQIMRSLDSVSFK